MSVFDGYEREYQAAYRRAKKAGMDDKAAVLAAKRAGSEYLILLQTLQEIRVPRTIVLAVSGHGRRRKKEKEA